MFAAEKMWKFLRREKKRPGLHRDALFYESQYITE